MIEVADVDQGFGCQLFVLAQGFNELAPGVRPAAQHRLVFQPVELLVDLVSVALDGSAEVFQQRHGGTGAPGSKVVVEEHASAKHVADAPHVSLPGLALFVVYHGDGTLVHLDIVAGQDLGLQLVI